MNNERPKGKALKQKMGREGASVVYIGNVKT